MRKPLFLSAILKTCVGAALVLSPAAPSGFAAEADARVELLKTLQTQSDSLGVEIQVLKRGGQEIGELEERTALLRDSITALKAELEKCSPAAPLSIEQAVNKSFLPKTMGLFDLVLIAGAGLIVLFALFILLAHGSAAARRGKGINRQRPMTKKREQRDTAITRACAAQVENVNVREMAAPEKAEIPHKPPAAVAPGPPAQTTPPSDFPQNLSGLVVRAAGQGLDIKDISVRYHISADQVSLILKMAKRQQ